MESENPIAAYALDAANLHAVRKPSDMVTMSPQSLAYSLDRDDDEIPEDIEDDGDDNNDGDKMWVLISSFQDGEEKSGKIWAVPEDDNDEGFTLISGLNRPTGVCFDVNHEFLYVCD